MVKKMKKKIVLARHIRRPKQIKERKIKKRIISTLKKIHNKQSRILKLVSKEKKIERQALAVAHDPLISVEEKAVLLNEIMNNRNYIHQLEQDKKNAQIKALEELVEKRNNNIDKEINKHKHNILHSGEQKENPGILSKIKNLVTSKLGLGLLLAGNIINFFSF